MIVQIYGITTPEDASLVASLGVDHIGVVLDEGLGTWDQVDLATAGKILAAIPDGVVRIALSLGTDLDRITRTIDLLRPDVVHLARAADGMTPETVQVVRERVAPVRIMTTIPVRGPEAVDLARRFSRCSDSLLLDTADPESGVVGATGLTHDWSISSAVVRSADVPVILAGGLGPENVEEAIRTVAPWGVDSETRTSRSEDRRRKDPEKVRRFIEIARSTSKA